MNEGAVETDEIRAETTGDLTVWDAFKIGVKGANSMLLGSGIDIMLQAFEKVKFGKFYPNLSPQGSKFIQKAA